MNNLADLAQVIVAVLAFLGLVVAVVAWFYRRGGQERTMTDALVENTNATKEVTAELRDFKTVTISMLHDLDTRVTVLEAGKNS